MKRITLIILLLLSISSFGQDISIVKSEIFKDSKKRSSLEYSLEDNNGGLVIIRAYYGGLIKLLKGYYIQHFDSNLKLLKEIEYKINYSQIKNAFIKDNRLHLIEYKLENEKVVFNAVSANLDDFEFSSREIFSLSSDEQHKDIVKVNNIFSLLNELSLYDRDHTGEVVLSKNNNYFVINFDINNKDKETHKVIVFNNEFEKVYEQIIEKDIKDKYFEYNSIDVDDNDGTIYFLGKSYENETKKSKKDGKINYHFELYKVNSEGQKNISFKNEDKFISSLKLIKYKNELICVGFYGVKEEDKINGVSVFNINAETLAVENKKFIPFSEQFLTDKYGNQERKKKRKSEKGIKNIDFKDSFIMSNGDIVINAEESYVITHTRFSSNGGTKTTSTVHYDDIISLRIDKDGKLKWARNINKSQTGEETSSYTTIVVGDNSYFFINCADEIKKLSAGRIAFKKTSANRSNLYVIRIDKNGEFDYKKLIDDKDSEVYYKVNNGSINLDKQTVILIGKKKKKSRVIKLKI